MDVRGCVCDVRARSGFLFIQNNNNFNLIKISHQFVRVIDICKMYIFITSVNNNNNNNCLTVCPSGLLHRPLSQRR